MPKAKSTKPASSSSDEKPYTKPTSKKSKNPTNKKQGAWSAEELKALYEVMCPKRVSMPSRLCISIHPSRAL